MQTVKVIILSIILVGLAVYLITETPKIFEFLKQQPKPFESLKKPSSSITITATTTIATTTESLIPDYRGKIRISSVSVYTWSDYPAVISLSSSLPKEESVNITGWEIKSNRFSLTIPRAIEIYDPGNPPLEQDIIISGYQYINIYANKSPINRNLRLNRCTGYLNNSYEFKPSLPRDCPSIPREEFSHLSGGCQNYLFSLGRCQLPDINFYNSLPGTDEGNQCRAYLNTISHGSCFQKYHQQSDFLDNEWRIWINQNILDPFHDRLRLFDKDRKLVDEYIY